jgi:hypothetical protein
MVSNQPRIRVDFTDSSGSKYSVNIESPSKENLNKLLDFVQSISGPPPPSLDQQIPDTNFSRVYELIEAKFPLGQFTSSDILEAYQRQYKLTSTLSTISTYLARLAERRLLNRSRSRLGWIYRLNTSITETNNTVPEELQLGSNSIPR